MTDQCSWIQGLPFFHTALCDLASLLLGLSTSRASPYGSGPQGISPGILARPQGYGDRGWNRKGPGRGPERLRKGSGTALVSESLIN